MITSHRPSGARTASARRPQASTSSCSARAPGSTPAATKSSSPARPASERRNVFRRWPNPARTSANRSSGRHRRRSGGHVAAFDGDERRVHLRAGGGTRSAAPVRSTEASRPVRHLDADGAVGLRARSGRQPLRRPRPAPSPASARISGTPSSRSATMGVATLYGRLATRTAGCSSQQRRPIERPARRRAHDRWPRERPLQGRRQGPRPPRSLSPRRRCPAARG